MDKGLSLLQYIHFVCWLVHLHEYSSALDFNSISYDQKYDTENNWAKLDTGFSFMKFKFKGLSLELELMSS